MKDKDKIVCEDKSFLERMPEGGIKEIVYRVIKHIFSRDGEDNKVVHVCFKEVYGESIDRVVIELKVPKELPQEAIKEEEPYTDNDVAKKSQRARISSEEFKQVGRLRKSYKSEKTKGDTKKPTPEQIKQTAKEALDKLKQTINRSTS